MRAPPLNVPSKLGGSFPRGQPGSVQACARLNAPSKLARFPPHGGGWSPNCDVAMDAGTYRCGHRDGDDACSKVRSDEVQDGPSCGAKQRSGHAVLSIAEQGRPSASYLHFWCARSASKGDQQPLRPRFLVCRGPRAKEAPSLTILCFAEPSSSGHRAVSPLAEAVVTRPTSTFPRAQETIGLPAHFPSSLPSLGMRADWSPTARLDEALLRARVRRAKETNSPHVPHPFFSAARVPGHQA